MRSRIGSLAGRPAFALALGYVALAYGVLMALACTPAILRLLGPEAFGLAGLLITAQAVFQFVDAGVTPTANREAARFRGGAQTAAAFRNTIRGLEAWMLLACLPVVALASVVATPIAEHWIRRESLSLDEVSSSLGLMSVIVALRLLIGFRKGMLTGFERHKTLHALNMLIATLRFPVQILVFSAVQPGALPYFVYQLAVSLVEAGLYWSTTRRLMPDTQAAPLATCMRSLRPLRPLIVSQMFLALIWIVVSQTDKVLLSSLLPLSQYGHFTLAITAASGALLVAGPITQMLAPRLTRLHAAGDEAGFRETYHRFTRINSVFLASIAAACGAFGTELVVAWTGDASIAAEVGPLLAWYAMGNAVMSVAGLSYFVQHAVGRIRLHVIGTIVFMLVIVPALAWATQRYGVTGAALTWFSVNLAFLLLWVPLSHRAVVPGVHWRWLVDDILRIALPTGLCAFAVRQGVTLPSDRMALIGALGVIAIGLLAVSLLASGLWRRPRAGGTSETAALP